MEYHAAGSLQKGLEEDWVVSYIRLVIIISEYVCDMGVYVCVLCVFGCVYVNIYSHTSHKTKMTISRRLFAL
jgi:hypothetical protein